MQSDDNKDVVLASTNTVKNNEDNTESSNEGVIKAAELQDKVEVVQKRDLSAIIPQGDNNSESQDILESKEKVLKSDGSVVIGSIDNDNLTMVEGAKFPDKIDIESRKKEKQDALKAKKNVGVKKKKTLSEEDKKAQNVTSLIVIVVIILLGLFGYYYFNKTSESDFTVKVINLELGESLPVHTSDYVIPANLFKVGKFDFSSLFKKKNSAKDVSLDDLEYSINTSAVKIDEVGDYTYSVTHEGVTKSSTIHIKDTKAPELKTREVRIMEGSTYSPQSFIVSCHDLSGCGYEYESADMGQFTNPGIYRDIKIIAKDPYDNKITENVSLIIEAKGDVRTYKKVSEFNQELGYALTSTYEVHLSYANQNVQLLYYANYINEYVYQDEAKYNEDVKKNEGDKLFTFDKKNLKITKEEKVDSIGNLPNSNFDYINEYLIKEGYTEIK